MCKSAIVLVKPGVKSTLLSPSSSNVMNGFSPNPTSMDRKEHTVKRPGCLPDSSSVTVNVDDVEVGHGGIARGLARLVLKLVQVAALGESVHSQHLHTDTTASQPSQRHIRASQHGRGSTDTTAQSVTHQSISTWERVHRHHSTVSDTSEHLNMGEGPLTPQHSQ